MQTLPVFLDIQGRRCLLVGVGETADRKRQMLLRAGALVVSIADTFSVDDLTDIVLVVAASSDQTLNERVSIAARSRHIPVNVVDQPQLCTFIFPAIVERGLIVVAVSSGGAVPVLTRLLRARIETLLPSSLGDFAQQAAAFRSRVRDTLPDMRQRLRFWDNLLQQQFIGCASSNLVNLDKKPEFDRALADFVAGNKPGRINVVGAGPGDPDLLTFKALRCLQACDLVVYDENVSAAFVDLARRDAQRHCLQSHENPATLLQENAGQGAHVVYLKSGDPLSHRGVTLLLAQWQASGIACDVVPGVIDQSGAHFDAI